MGSIGIDEAVGIELAVSTIHQLLGGERSVADGVGGVELVADQHRQALKYLNATSGSHPNQCSSLSVPSNRWLAGKERRGEIQVSLVMIRLVGLKNGWDSENLFRLNQTVKPTV